MTEDLSRNYPDPLPGLFNIGLLHTSLTGRLGHDNYAPTTPDALNLKGYDYWALGHVHAREIVQEEPWIIFPGNLQGRQVRESGAKGATLVTVRDGRVATVTHRCLDVLRWCSIAVPVGGERDLDIMDHIGRALSGALDAAEGRPIAARITLTGATQLHEQLLAEAERVRQGVLAEGLRYGADAVWIESAVIDTVSTANRESLLARPDVVGRLTTILDELIAADGDQLLGDYRERLGSRFPASDLPTDHPLREGGKALLNRARELVLASLVGEV